MSRILHVLLEGQHAGDVTQSEAGNLTYSYRPEYLASAIPTPLSLSMPPGPGMYRQKQIRAYLNGLLPDSDDVRARWAQQFGVSAENPAALLRHMGLDCAGAAQFTEGDSSAVLNRTGGRQPLTDLDIAQRLRQLRRDASEWTVPGERWSLAGAQAKFALARDPDGLWHEPTGSTPSTHIFKPGVSGYRDQALNEHLCLSACRLIGVRAAHTEFTSFGDQSALVVTRYDRARTSEGVLRLHQEDMCQALSVPPRRKYETSGGPTAQQIVRLLRDAGVPEEDLYRFVDGLILNYLLGAPDAHAKNFSVLLRGNAVRLAPLYDVASALPYEPETQDHELDQAAMSIGGEKRFGYVGARNWAKLARALELNEGRITLRVHELATRLPDALRDVARDHRGELADRLTAAVAALAKTTIRDLDRRVRA